MKNLGKTIDQLILIDKNLEKALKSIKNKWKRYPKRTENYWTELLKLLNSDNLMLHPKRDRMSKVINNVKKRKRPNYSFEVLSKNDRVVGLVTGHLADKVKRLDLRSVQIAKERLEANMTHNLAMQIETVRKDQILEVETKKVWIVLRDHFKLWALPGNYNLKISTENNLVYLVEQSVQPQMTGPGMIKMDPRMIKKFFEFMGMEPPPELFGGKK